LATPSTTTGGLLTEIQAETRTAGTSCAVGKTLRSLSKALASDLEAALADQDTYPGAAIARAITARGHRLSSGQIQHHRRGGCSCGR